VFGSGTAATLAAIVGSGLSLFAVGAAMSLLTGRTWLFSGVRMLLIGAAAAAITFGVGSLIGVSVG
jgi:VIT1/CCC1 family predicted Fe2+/Mn2+ transporter